MALKEHFTFLSQTLKNFKHTGSVAPSSPYLAHEMAWPLRQARRKPWRVLEVGAGTGAFTRALCKEMGKGDSLDCYELNGEFFGHLRESVEGFKGRTVRLHHKDIRELGGKERFDLVVSGLPFNNFSPGLVDEIMAKLYAALKPGATLVYFEYLFLRSARKNASLGKDRKRLAGIEEVLARWHGKGKTRDEIVWLNLPPALVRSLTKGG